MAALEADNFCVGSGTESTVLTEAKVFLEIADTVAGTTLFEGWFGSVTYRANDWLGGGWGGRWGWGGNGNRNDWLGQRGKRFGAVEGVHFCPGVRADDAVTGSSAGGTTRTGDVIGELEFLHGKFGGRAEITVNSYARRSSRIGEGVLQIANTRPL